MQTLLEQIQSFLQKVASEPTPLPNDIVEEFGEACKKALRNRFLAKPRKFNIYMSNIGQPLGQLQRDKAGLEKEKPAYTDVMKFLYGDLIEAAAIALIKAAGIKIQSEQEPLELNIGGMNLRGRYDIEIDNGLWEIKSASPWSFKNKFQGFLGLAKDDVFGYVTQGYLYETAAEKPFMGWIVVDKSVGEWSIVETPAAPERYSENVLKEVEEKIYALNDKTAPLQCCCSEEDETFYKKKTGNKVLGFPGKFCKHKFACYPNLQYLPKQESKSKSPEFVWYTDIATK